MSLSKDLTLWKVSIPIVAKDIHKAISLDELESDVKTELLPSDELLEVFDGLVFSFA